MSNDADHLRRLAGLAHGPQVPPPVASPLDASDRGHLRELPSMVKETDGEFIRRLVAAAVADMPPAIADPLLIRAEVERAAAALPQAKGDRGPPGPDGELGLMPAHEWDGAKLRFEAEPGIWGEWVDLRGPRGRDGHGAAGLPGPVGPPGPPAPVSFSYFPNGW